MEQSVVITSTVSTLNAWTYPRCLRDASAPVMVYVISTTHAIATLDLDLAVRARVLVIWMKMLANLMSQLNGVLPLVMLYNSVAFLSL